MLSLRLQITMHRENPVQCCLNAYGMKLHRQKPCAINVVQETLDNITQEKILCIVILILREQHCTDKNPLQCCPWGSRQQCMGKYPVKCCLNILGINCTGKSPVQSLLSKRLQTICTGKNPVQCCFNTPGTTLCR